MAQEPVITQETVPPPSQENLLVDTLQQQVISFSDFFIVHQVILQ
jgi:hypothetical protein